MLRCITQAVSSIVAASLFLGCSPAAQPPPDATYYFARVTFPPPGPHWDEFKHALHDTCRSFIGLRCQIETGTTAGNEGPRVLVWSKLPDAPARVEAFIDIMRSWFEALANADEFAVTLEEEQADGAAQNDPRPRHRKEPV